MGKIIKLIILSALTLTSGFSISDSVVAPPDITGKPTLGGGSSVISYGSTRYGRDPVSSALNTKEAEEFFKGAETSTIGGQYYRIKNWPKLQKVFNGSVVDTCVLTVVSKSRARCKFSTGFNIYGIEAFKGLVILEQLELTEPEKYNKKYGVWALSHRRYQWIK